MYNNEKFWVVTEANVGASDVINMANYTFTGADGEKQAYSKLYRLWGYGANPEQGETRQLLSAYMTEHRGNQIILLEAKVFDYREPEPAPEPEPEE
jgi:hypothetical protein